MYSLGRRSRAELDGVHPDLVRVVEHALSISPVDFAVNDGIRTVSEQRAAVDRGASQTMASRHLTGHAVDLVPYLDGALRWDWPALYLVAGAMREAGIALGVPLRWGAAWDITLTETAGSLEAVSAQYVARRKATRRKAFLDGPHFELPASRYP